MALPANVLSYIVLSADEDDLDRVIQAVRDRRKTLATAAAADVQTGASVELHNLSPKALNGLTGDVDRINGKRADVLLDEDSTQRLRFSNTRYSGAVDFALRDGSATRYTLTGVPLTTLRVIKHDAA
jgi:hypothetical protein